MTKIIGRLIDLGVAVEGTRGTGEVVTNMIPKSNITFDDKVLKARSTVGYGTINLEGNQALVARRHAEGVVDFDLLDISFGIFLKALLGTVSSGAVVDSSYTHTFSLSNNNQHASLSMLYEEAGVGNLSFRLCMIETLTMTIVPEDVVKITATFMGRHSKTAGSSAVTYIAEHKFLGRHLDLKIEDAVGDLAAGTNIPVRSLTLNFAKNLKLVHNSGTVEPEDILNQGFRITGEVELDYENRTYADLMNDGTYKAIRVQLTNSEVKIGAGSTNPQFLIDLSRCDFENWEPARPNDELASQTFLFTGLHDITNNNVINNCILVNSHDGSNYA